MCCRSSPSPPSKSLAVIPHLRPLRLVLAMRKAARAASEAISAQSAKPQRAPPTRQPEYLPLVAHASAYLAASRRLPRACPAALRAPWPLRDPHT